MRVALNCQLLSMNTTGVTRYISELVRAFPRVDNSHCYTLLLNHHVPQDLLPPQDGGADGCIERWLTHFPIVGTRSRIVWEQFVQPLELAVHGFDVVHHTDRSMPWLPTGIPSVSTIHDISYASFPETYTWGKVLYNEITVLIAATRADRIITAAESTKRELVSYLNVPEEKIRVVYDAASEIFQPIPSTEVLREARQRLKLPERLILYVGSLNPRKNIVTLLQAYSQLRRTSGLSHKLVLVGPKEWKSGFVFQTIRDLGLQSEVLWLGLIPDRELVYLYNLADLFVFPSLHEGFGLPALEALACGTPVVCSDRASLPEVVGDAACMVDATDVDAFALAMERVLLDPDLARRMRGDGLEQAKRFSWEKTARGTLKVYKEVVKGSGERAICKP